MKNYKKAIVTSIISVVFGLSCCWLSSIIVWFGGVAFVASMSKYLDGSQIFFLSVGVVAIFVSTYLYRKTLKKEEG